jgi:chromosomal replication initiator protein
MSLTPVQSQEELNQPHSQELPISQIQEAVDAHKKSRPSDLLAEDIPETDSKLTFDRFVAGEENMLALEAAKQVANGVKKL